MASGMGPRVAYVNLAGQHQALKGELLNACAEVFESGQFILGPQVREFEQQFAALCGVDHAVTVNSGTDALLLALRALDIGPGDDVITVPNSFVATAAAIALVGARPVFVDVGDDYNLDPGLLERALTPRTRAILPVHLTGRPADMGPILEIARRHGIPVIEDAAQAVLAEYQGQRVGSFGVFGCFSFHPLKNLNACGDAGVLTTRDATLAEKVRILRNLGLRSRDDCVVWSGNSRLDTLQAALLLVKLRYLPAWTEARRANAAFYHQALADCPEVTVPTDSSATRSVYHTCVMRARERDRLKWFLADRGIETAIHYPVPIHLSKAAAGAGPPPGSFPRAEAQAREILSLPVYPELTTEQLEWVVQGIRDCYIGQ